MKYLIPEMEIVEFEEVIDTLEVSGPSYEDGTGTTVPEDWNI